MAIRKASAAKVAALVPTNAIVADVTSPEYNRDEMVARLANAKSAKDRTLLLSALPMGEVAALGGIVAKIGTSINEVLNIKLCQKHGNDWVGVLRAVRSDLCEADKTRRKEIEASIEGIRETLKSNNGGDQKKAADTIRRIKEWGEGVRQSKGGANANKKEPLDVWFKSWDIGPRSFRRIKNDDMESISPELGAAFLALADAQAAIFKLMRISPQAVLECKGPTDWQA
jgi:hypothetical protein